MGKFEFGSDDFMKNYFNSEIHQEMIREANEPSYELIEAVKKRKQRENSKKWRNENKDKIKEYNDRYNKKQIEEDKLANDDKAYAMDRIKELNEKYNTKLTYDTFRLIKLINDEKKHQLYLSVNHKPKNLYYNTTTLNILKEIAKNGLDNLTISLNSYNFNTNQKSLENLKYVQFLAVDIDSLSLNTHELLNKIEKEGLPAPTVIICSGNGYHVLWKIKRFFATDFNDNTENNNNRKLILETLRILQLNIAKKLNGDLSFSNDFTRSTRIPTSFNIKNDIKKEVRLEYINESNVYDFSKDFNFSEAIEENKAIKKKRFKAIKERKNTTKSNFKYKKQTLPVKNMSHIEDIVSIIRYMQTNEEFDYLNGDLEGFRYELIRSAIFAGSNAEKINNMLENPLAISEIKSLSEEKKNKVERNTPTYYKKIDTLLEFISNQIKQKYNKEVIYSDDFILNLRLIKNSVEVEKIKQEVKAEFKDTLTSFKKVFARLKKNLEQFITYHYTKQFTEENKKIMTKGEITQSLEVILNMKKTKIYSMKNIYLNKIQNDSVELVTEILNINTILLNDKKYLNNTEIRKATELLDKSKELMNIIKNNLGESNTAKDISIANLEQAIHDFEQFKTA